MSEIGELLLSINTQIIDVGTEKHRNREEVDASEASMEQLDRDIISMATSRRDSQARKIHIDEDIESIELNRLLKKLRKFLTNFPSLMTSLMSITYS